MIDAGQRAASESSGSDALVRDLKALTEICSLSDDQLTKTASRWLVVGCQFWKDLHDA
jgi:hypothetical protein